MSLQGALFNTENAKLSWYTSFSVWLPHLMCENGIGDQRNVASIIDTLIYWMCSWGMADKSFISRWLLTYTDLHFMGPDLVYYSDTHTYDLGRVRRKWDRCDMWWEVVLICQYNKQVHLHMNYLAPLFGKHTLRRDDRWHSQSSNIHLWYTW